MRSLVMIIFGLTIFSQTVFSDYEKTKGEQISALKKRIEVLKEEVKKAERDYKESLSVSFDQYMDTAKGVGKEMAGKIHVMRDKMDYEEEKFNIKKRLKELKEELKSAETRLMVMQA